MWLLTANVVQFCSALLKNFRSCKIAIEYFIQAVAAIVATQVSAIGYIFHMYPFLYQNPTVL